MLNNFDLNHHQLIRITFQPSTKLLWQSSPVTDAEGQSKIPRQTDHFRIQSCWNAEADQQNIPDGQVD